MNLENLPEIRKEDEPILLKYWDYLKTKRATVDSSLLGEADIANIFMAPEDIND
jgi:hypothetical protein